MKTYQLVLTLALVTAFAHPGTLFSQNAPTKAPPEQVYEAGHGVKPPRAIYAPDPEYPETARRERQQGTVVISVVVGSDGSPRDIKVKRPFSPELDESAINTVKKWKFAPGTKDGEPVAVQIVVEISFRL